MQQTVVSPFEGFDKLNDALWNACEIVSQELSKELSKETGLKLEIEIPDTWFDIADDGTVDLYADLTVVDETDDYYVIYDCNRLHHLPKYVLEKVGEYVKEYLNE